MDNPTGITECVDKLKHPFADQLATEVCWMAERLMEARVLIKNAPIVMPYDNGGGQKGIRRNPAYEAYESLFKSFVKGCEALDEVLKDARPVSREGKAILDSLRANIEKTRQEYLNSVEERGFTVQAGGK